MLTEARSLFRLRSFVRRSGRQTDAQESARVQLWPRFGLQVTEGLLSFVREAPRHLEIGFGTGQSLLALAKAHPEKDFIGVETHKPGIGALFLGIQNEQLTNLRVFDADIIDVLAHCIANASLDAVQIFFPDPWPKRRHHARRLIQPDFLSTIVEKLKSGGELHVATDWEDYAKHMQQVFQQETRLLPLANTALSNERSPLRPVPTKFERRALRDGRKITEFQLHKI